jgi:glycerophosphoryl diester phosphodiesterase
MNDPLAVATLAGDVGGDFWRCRRALFVYEILFKLAEAWLLVPTVAVILTAILVRAGRVAVTNHDVLDFLLTPLGLLYAVLFGIATVAVMILEQAGIMALATRRGPAERLPLGQMLQAVFHKSLRIAELSAVQAALMVLALIPFVVLAVLTYGLLLTEHDIDFYWKVGPPVFWVAVGIGGILVVAALTVGTLLFVRWAFALPILLFENKSPRAALRASRSRMRGVGWRVGLPLLGWMVGVLVLGGILEVVFRLFAEVALNMVGDRPLTLIPLLIGQGSLVATVSFALVTGLGLVKRRLYLRRNGELGLSPPGGREAVPGADQSMAPRGGWLGWLTLPLFLLAPIAVWTNLLRYQAEYPLVRVTALRGHARVAPENTLSAMRKAIESRADYAAADVQLTADGVVVLLQDRDLARVAGVSKRLDELSYDEVRRLDVGRWFDPAFAGERVPTLAEVIGLCRGKIRLNIELESFGPDQRLASEVADVVRALDFESECIVTSLNYDALVEARRRSPRLRVGLTVAHALGDLSRLEVDALCVTTDFLSDELLQAAHRLHREVHVWTVNDAPQMARLIKRGVDNLITGEPDLAIRVRDEWASMTDAERLVLASRLLLGLNP